MFNFLDNLHRLGLGVFEESLVVIEGQRLPPIFLDYCYNLLSRVFEKGLIEKGTQFRGHLLESPSGRGARVAKVPSQPYICHEGLPVPQLSLSPGRRP